MTREEHLAFGRSLGAQLSRSARVSFASEVRRRRAEHRSRMQERVQERRTGADNAFRDQMIREHTFRRWLADEQRVRTGRAVEASALLLLSEVLGRWRVRRGKGLGVGQGMGHGMRGRGNRAAGMERELEERG